MQVDRPALGSSSSSASSAPFFEKGHVQTKRPRPHPSSSTSSSSSSSQDQERKPSKKAKGTTPLHHWHDPNLQDASNQLAALAKILPKTLSATMPVTNWTLIRGFAGFLPSLAKEPPQGSPERGRLLRDFPLLNSPAKFATFVHAALTEMDKICTQEACAPALRTFLQTLMPGWLPPQPLFRGWGPEEAPALTPSLWVMLESPPCTMKPEDRSMYAHPFRNKAAQAPSMTNLFACADAALPGVSLAGVSCLTETWWWWWWWEEWWGDKPVWRAYYVTVLLQLLCNAARHLAIKHQLAPVQAPLTIRALGTSALTSLFQAHTPDQVSLLATYVQQYG